jgi:hypothetical protein
MVDDAVLGKVAALHARAFGQAPECFVEKLRAGHHAGLVQGYMKMLAHRQDVEVGARQEAARVATGYALVWSDLEVLIRGPYCRHLSKTLLVLGGYWDGEGGRNRRCFVVQGASGMQIAQAFSRAAAAQASEAARRAPPEAVDEFMASA